MYIYFYPKILVKSLFLSAYFWSSRLPRNQQTCLLLFPKLEVQLVCLTLPLNLISGMTFQVMASFSSPRSVQASRNMILLELTFSTSILFTKQCTTVRDTTRGSWWGAIIYSGSFVVKLFFFDSQDRVFHVPGFLAILGTLMLVLVAACLMLLHLDTLYITLITYLFEVTSMISSGQLVVLFFIVKKVLGLSGRNSKRYPFLVSH